MNFSFTCLRCRFEKLFRTFLTSEDEEKDQSSLSYSISCGNYSCRNARRKDDAKKPKKTKAALFNEEKKKKLLFISSSRFFGISRVVNRGLDCNLDHDRTFLMIATGKFRSEKVFWVKLHYSCNIGGQYRT